MKITNKSRIPDPIYRSIKAGWYDGANVDHYASVTGLLKPAKIFVLEKRHADAITEEATDLIWSLMGSAMHAVLEKSECDNSINEERLFTEINGKVISGAIDLYEKMVVSDYKFTSVWTYIYKSRMKEWTEQLNIYGYLYRKAGFPVKKLQIITIFRDWSKLKCKFEKRYPKQIETINLKLWDDKKVESFISSRIHLFEMALQLPDDDIPACSAGERWQTVKWAVMKEGGSRALKLFNTKPLAQQFIDDSGRSDLYIEDRTSKPTRCLEYCRCNKFCNFYNSLTEEQKAA